MRSDSSSDNDNRQTAENKAFRQRSMVRLQACLETDSELRLALPVPNVHDELSKCGSAIEFLARACELHGDKPAFGSRAFEVVPESERRDRRVVKLLDRFTTISYRQFWERVSTLATAYQHHATCPLQRGGMVGMLAFTTCDVVVAQTACLYLG